MGRAGDSPIQPIQIIGARNSQGPAKKRGKEKKGDFFLKRKKVEEEVEKEKREKKKKKGKRGLEKSHLNVHMILKSLHLKLKKWKNHKGL